MGKIVTNMYKQHKDVYAYAYFIPFLAMMFSLETEYKRWIFMIGVILESYYRLNSCQLRSNSQTFCINT